MAASPDEIKTVFRSFDLERKKSLNAKDLRAIISGLVSEEDAHEIVAEEPLDADGRITYDEFVDRLCVVDAPKVCALQDFWRLAGPSGSCALADLQAVLPSGRAPPVVDDSGLVTRDVFLAWLFGHEGGTPTLVRMALLTRTSALLMSARLTLAPVFENMDQHPMHVLRESYPTKIEGMKAWWDETLAEFPVLNTKPAPAVAAAHFLNVVRAGLDANAVAFPQMPRPAKSFPPAGFPSSRPSSASRASQQDARPFLLPHVCEGGGARREASPEDAEIAEPDCWLDGLARHVEELCAGKYDGEPLDMEVTPWAEQASGIIAADTCTKAQERVIAKRAELGEFSAERLERISARRFRRIAAYFAESYGTSGEIYGNKEFGQVNPRVFAEILPELEREAALQAVQSRHDADKAAAAAAHDNLAGKGAAFVCWPEAGSRKWKPDRSLKSHAQWFARWRATPRVTEKLEHASLPEEKAGDLAGRLKRSDSNASISSWLSVSDISWLEVESRAEECSWKEVVEDSRPQLIEARSALDVLSKAAISELKALSAPPAGVQLVMEVVCIILGVRPRIRIDSGEKIRDYWVASKELLGDSNFMDRLTSIEYLPKPTLDALAPYIELDGFRVECIMKCSFAAAGLCEWARAIFKYHTLVHASGVARDKELAGRPKEDLLFEALASLDELCLADVQELKALGRPPRGVCEVCTCVMHLVAPELSDKRKNSLWGSCQKMMSNPSAFLVLLRQFPQSISEGLVSSTHIGRARKMVQGMGTNFSAEEMSKKSKAVAGFSSWVLNVIAYYDQINPRAQEAEGRAPAKAEPKVLDPQVLAVLLLVERVQESELSEIGSIEEAPPILKNVCKSIFQLLAGLAGDFTGTPAADNPTWDECKAMIESPGLFLKRLSAVPEAISTGRMVLCRVETARRCRASLGEDEASLLALAEAANELKWQCRAEVHRVASVESKCRSSRNNCLCKADITELKALSHPPAAVGRVMEAVCVCLGVEPQKVAGPDGEAEREDYWGPSKKLLADVHLLPKLFDFSAADMSDEVINKLQPLLADDFKPESVMKSSGAAAGLCHWVWNNVALRGATLEAKEKQAALEEAEANLEQVEALGRGGPVAVNLSAYLAEVLGYFDASVSGASAIS